MTGEQPRDLSRYLPLSNRPRVDESTVSGDWGTRLDELSDAVGDVPTRSDLLDELVAAVQHARRRKRVRIGDLGRVLVAAYEATEGRVVVDPATSGAVCLARALAAPLPIRSVVRGRTLKATDAGWEIGTGPELAGTARELTLFLYGRGPLPGSAP